MIGKFQLVSMQLYFDVYWADEAQTLIVSMYIYFLVEVFYRSRAISANERKSWSQNVVRFFSGSCYEVFKIAISWLDEVLTGKISFPPSEWIAKAIQRFGITCKTLIFFFFGFVVSTGGFYKSFGAVIAVEWELMYGMCASVASNTN